MKPEIKLIVQSIRENLKWFGFDLDDLSDEEILEGSLQLSKLVKKSGFTVEEMHKALVILGSAGKGTT